MPLTSFIVCLQCGAEAVNITSFTDIREQFLCVECGAKIEGDPLDMAEKEIEREKFNALIEQMRAADRGE
jgi:DNA-directed RNA polymerase subunit RPC12/RpoP